MAMLWRGIAQDNPSCFELLGVRYNDRVYSETALSGLQVCRFAIAACITATHDPGPIDQQERGQ